MISKGKIKLIKSLAHKKYRQKEHLFLVEGEKNVLEVLNSKYRVTELFAVYNFLKSNETLVNHADYVREIKQEELKKASLLKQPQGALAVCSIPDEDKSGFRLDDFSLFLDDIQDPGNMGTIIRICDWFGINNISCSPGTADIYNPKVIQASMGSFCRVKVTYTTFDSVFDLAAALNIPVFGTFLEGQNIYQQELPQNAVVVMGNEGKGISSEIEQKIDLKLKIPSCRKQNNGHGGAESLNVGVATGIICSEFKRRLYN